jgi:hypothetical protein
MEKQTGCQLPCIPEFSDGEVRYGPFPIKKSLKRFLARPWNYFMKRFLKQGYKNVKPILLHTNLIAPDNKAVPVHYTKQNLQPGDWVRVRSRIEIESGLNPWKELKGCAFLDDMWKYCDTKQRVLKPMRQFLDERDYRLKKSSGIILLEGILCQGTPVFGPCDRSCYLFWREEWLEKVEDEKYEVG